jgi:hypothetical protein
MFVLFTCITFPSNFLISFDQESYVLNNPFYVAWIYAFSKLPENCIPPVRDFIPLNLFTYEWFIPQKPQFFGSVKLNYFIRESKGTIYFAKYKNEYKDKILS